MPSLELTPAQEKAVKHKKGPLLVVAGPGTGKTRVITERIRYLIQEKELEPSSILALTFTEKAAEEMISRVDEVMPLGYEEPWISTFHSFCDRILRDEGLEIGLDPAYKIITPPESWLLIRQNLFDFDLKYYRPMGNPTRFISALLTLFSRSKDEEVGPDEYLLWVEKLNPTGSKRSTRRGKDPSEADRQLEVALAYKKYQELLTENSYLDFGDLIFWTNKLFRERPNILKKYQEKFKEILVDEFQDTNIAQYSLVKLLADPKKSPSLLVVGDEDQAVYKWRGASLSNILQFRDDYPTADTVVLDTTFRLPKAHAQKTHTLIQNNNPDRLEVKLNISKKLKTVKNHAEPLFLAFETSEDEVESVLRKIVELIKEYGYRYKDFAILARANSHLEPFVAGLKRHALPYQFVGNRGLFEQDEVAALIAVLKVIKDPQDHVSWYRVLTVPSLGLNHAQVFSWFNKAAKQAKPLVEVLEEERVEVVDIISKLREDALKISPSHILYDFIKETGYIKSFTQIETVENNLRIENVNLFFKKIHAFEEEAQEPNVFELVGWLDLLREAGESPAQAVIEDIDVINLLTVHSAKGLEFPVVFIVSLSSDRFPTRRRSDPIELPEEFVKEIRAEGDEHLQEERRLFYVGCTRASERLFLTAAKNYGGVREKKFSPFARELGLEAGRGEDTRRVSQHPPGVREKIQAPYSQEFEWQLPERLSYSQLADYKNCPWKYRYRYILKIPAPPTPPMSFGTSMHETLREFHERQMRGEELRLKDLLKLYKDHFSHAGYRDRKEKQAYFERGENMLKNYFKKHKEALFPPFGLELAFEIKVGGKTIAGRIDRIGKDKKLQEYELIDYKTGDTTDVESQTLKKRAKQDDQLLIYSMAAKEYLKIEPKNIALFHLDSGEKTDVEFTPAEVEKRKKELEERIKGMEKGDFTPTPGFHCKFCAFKDICPYSEADKL